MTDPIAGLAARPSGTIGAARLAVSQRTHAPAPAEASGFAQVVANMAVDTAQAVRGAETAATAGIRGDMPVQEVVAQVMEAERSVNAAIAIRDKVVAAYMDISRMQI